MFPTHRTSWELFQFLEAHESGEGSYLQAELIACHRAMDIMKSLGPGEAISFQDWIEKAVEYANHFPNIGAKYRDVVPRLMALANYGLVIIDGDPDQDSHKAMVKITPKGYLAEPYEYYKKREVFPPRDETALNFFARVAEMERSDIEPPGGQ